MMGECVVLNEPLRGSSRSSSSSSSHKGDKRWSTRTRGRGLVENIKTKVGEE